MSESRRAKQWRTRTTPHHELLGRPESNEVTREVRWRNILRLKDVEWLQGHQFQRQVLLPAAGYLMIAVDAVLHLVRDAMPVRVIELQDVAIHNAITLEEGSPGVEVTFKIRLEKDDDTLKTAYFSCGSTNASATSPAFEKLVMTGHVILETGLPSEYTLPERVPSTLPMATVSTDRFYTWIQQIGLRYSEHFLLDTILRRMGVATVTKTCKGSDRYTIHPGTLDSILQGLYAAFAYPGDGRLWTAYLPKSFRRARFSMHRSEQARGCADSKLIADIRLSESNAGSMSGDIDVFSASDYRPEIQFQDIVFSALEVPSEANDRSMFWKTSWKRQISSSKWPHQQLVSTTQVQQEICERIVYFHLRRLRMKFALEGFLNTGRS
jgi:acyl transferase domain-containing protein